MSYLYKKNSISFGSTLKYPYRQGNNSKKKYIVNKNQLYRIPVSFISSEIILRSKS